MGHTVKGATSFWHWRQAESDQTEAESNQTDQSFHLLADLSCKFTICAYSVGGAIVRPNFLNKHIS